MFCKLSYDNAEMKPPISSALEEFTSCLYLWITSMMQWNYAHQQTAVVTHKYEAMQLGILNTVQYLGIICDSVYQTRNFGDSRI